MSARRPIFNALVAPLAGGPVSHDEAKQMLDSYRAEVLREAADVVTSAFHGEPFLNYPPDFAELLRRMADEAGKAGEHVHQYQDFGPHSGIRCVKCNQPEQTGEARQDTPTGGESTQPSPWQRAVDGLNALIDARIPFHLEPDGHISNLNGPEHIEWDRTTERWVLTIDTEDEPPHPAPCRYPASPNCTVPHAAGEATQPAEACGNCRQPFNPTDTRFDGLGRHGDTPFCRRCVDRCHESTDAFHQCAVCRIPAKGGDAR